MVKDVIFTLNRTQTFSVVLEIIYLSFESYNCLLPLSDKLYIIFLEIVSMWLNQKLSKILLFKTITKIKLALMASTWNSLVAFLLWWFVYSKALKESRSVGVPYASGSNRSKRPPPYIQVHYKVSIVGNVLFLWKEFEWTKTCAEIIDFDLVFFNN